MSGPTASQVEQLCTLLEARAGLLVGSDRHDALRQAMQEVLRHDRIPDYDKLISDVEKAEKHDETLLAIIERIVIGETFFFRDDSQFKALREVVLPSILEYRGTTNRCINILSAGCSSGEEPYSIAMLLNELLPEPMGWTIHLVGGDISQHALTKARAARYGEWSFRGVPTRFINRYFKRQGMYYELNDEIKRMVRFQPLNVADGIPFIDLDLIMWRNVAIYLSPEKIRQVAAACFRALRDDGWLFVAATELSQEYFRSNEVVQIGDAMVYRKNGAREKPYVTLPPLPELSPSPPRVTSPAFPLGHSTGRHVTLPPPEKSAAFPSPPSAAQDASPCELAERMWKQGEVSRAVELLNGLTRSEPRALYLLARIHADRGDHEKAEEICSRYLDHVPDSLDGYYLLAMICQADDKEALAAEALRKAVFLDRDFVMGHWSLGVLYCKLGKPKAAHRHLLHARQLLHKMPPHHTVAHSDGQTAGRILTSTDHALRNLGVTTQ